MGKKQKKSVEVAKAVGVEVGKTMTFEEADMKHPNPHYGEDEQYRINCQSCVVAYELRRRGLPVEAFGRVKSCMGERLAYDTQAAWIGADGKMPTPIVCKQTVKSRTIDSRGYMRTTYTSAKDVWRDFASKTADQGRYHVRWSWNGRDTGHIITMETLKDGTRRFYDPQTGLESKFINPWMYGRSGKVSFDMKKGIFAYRVDNLQPNPLIVKGVVKKAGTTGAAPAITAEQKAWWLENAQGATSFMGNGTYKDLNSWRKEIRKSSKLAVQEHSHSANLDTGYIRRSGQARINLIKHIRNEEELKAAEYIWDNPQSLRFVRHSPLGEVKDLSVEKDIKNIQNKKARFVTSYNVYEVDYNGITWEVKAEVYKNKAEQIYNIKKK